MRHFGLKRYKRIKPRVKKNNLVKKVYTKKRKKEFKDKVQI